uniref:Gamma-secretase subunit Aph-1 n=1 Tax=Cacopsylla melanoneura TaxID=428564 RepID=A0A8D8LIC1_9HEMI
MTYMEFLGCTMTAFGPIIAMFLTTIMQDPVKVIILVASAFFWLLSLLVSSIVWFIIRNQCNIIFGVIISVLCQEVFRYILYLILQKSRGGLQYVSDRNTMDNTYAMAYVSGLGFGIISAAFSLLNVLDQVSGPGTMGLKGDSQYFGFITSITTCCFSLLHIFWALIFFRGVEIKNRSLVASVVLSHVFISSYTWYMSSSGTVLGLFSMIFIVLFTLVWAMFAYKVIGGSRKSMCNGENLIEETN